MTTVGIRGMNFSIFVLYSIPLGWGAGLLPYEMSFKGIISSAWL